MSLTPRGYMPRIADQELSEMLGTFGAVCIEGPKWSGKTWIALNQSNSAFMVNDPANMYNNRVLAHTDPRIAFEGDRPHLVDEWQEEPALWDATKYFVDESGGTRGSFILTGSSTPVLKGVRHSGAGRIGRLRIRTMTLAESGDSDGSVALTSLFEGAAPEGRARDVRLRELISLAVRGGWPEVVSNPSLKASKIAEAYLETVIEDAARLDGSARRKDKVAATIASLARNESTLASEAKIAGDVGEGISLPTVNTYLDALDRLFVRADQPPFAGSPRSPVRVRGAPKRHLADPSLSIAALHMGEESLYRDLNTFGFMFEAMCERDLDVYSSAIGGRLYHYHDYRDNEADAVVQLEDGRWGAFEIKLGFGEVDRAAEDLKRISGLFGDGGPEFLCVICGLADRPFRRPDGVYVVPITSLGVRGRS